MDAAGSCARRQKAGDEQRAKQAEQADRANRRPPAPLIGDGAGDDPPDHPTHRGAADVQPHGDAKLARRNLLAEIGHRRRRDPAKAIPSRARNTSSDPKSGASAARIPISAVAPNEATTIGFLPRLSEIAPVTSMANARARVATEIVRLAAAGSDAQRSGQQRNSGWVA